jgi:N utilization substance protein A
MNADFLAILDYWEREKGISKDVLVGAVQEALVSAAKKAVGPARELRCLIDPKTGDIKAFAKLIVTDKVISKHDQISLTEARRKKADSQIGEELEVEVTPTGFGRIIFEEFKDRVGDLVSGTVRRFERSDVIMDLGRYEALLPNRERVPTEEYQIGERIRCFVKAVENGPHGPEIILSRAAPEFVLKLFKLEVSEISNGTVEVKGCAREPGFRTKLAVFSRDPKVDPVGACVGLRGQRVKNIVRELNNEKMDIIKWDPSIKIYITNALAPAVLKSVTVDEANHALKILVDESQLSLAIGKRGQNARLASRLTGWAVNIDAEAVASLGIENKIQHAIDAFAAVPGVSREMAEALVNTGFHALEDVVTQAEEADLKEIPSIGEHAGEVLAAIKEAAKLGSLAGALA